MLHSEVLHSPISLGSYQEFIGEIFRLVRLKTPSYVCFANVHMVVESSRDKVLHDAMHKANIVAPDGKPISLFLRFFENIRQDRVCGMDLLPDLLRQAEVEHKSVYFYGTTQELLNLIVKKASIEFPGLKICGHHSPPFRVLSEEENATIANQIKAVSPDLVFVSLGCPKQEKWMAKNRDKIGACLLGVGQAFSVYAGTEKRLPKWMQNLSLEWAYRLYLEPQRLWKRYLFTNSHFLFLTMIYLVSRFIHDTYAQFTKIRIPWTS